MGKLALAILFALVGVAQAQESRAVVGGVDQRVPALEQRYLTSMAGQTVGQLLGAAAYSQAVLDVEKQDHEADKKQLDAANAALAWWLDPKNRAWVDGTH